MCGIPYCFIFGCGPRTRPVEIHQHRERMYCSFCGSTTRGEYVRDDFWFTLCFIPILPLYYGRPYLKCDVCNFRLSNISNNRKCPKCSKNVPIAYRFCPDCGTHIQ